MLLFNMNTTKTIQIRNPEESSLCAGLYIVPTPIGNLRDITLRGLDVLTACDAVICEDSRVTGKLLKAYDLPSKKKIIYNDHADEATKNYILELITNGQILALVSDAGTPLISDPGYKLVRDCMANGYYVTALPGANAVLPALQLSGLQSDSFTFGGFLPSKDKAMRDMIAAYANRRETILFYDTPKRIVKTVKALADVMPDRDIAIIREISKLYEQALTMKPQDMLRYLQDHPLKGELVLVIEGAKADATNSQDVDDMILRRLRSGDAVKDIAAQISDATGLKKKEIYKRALSIKETEQL